MHELRLTSLILTIIGGLNLGLIGLFNFDLIAALFGEMSFITRSFYVIIGIGAFTLLLFALARETGTGHIPPTTGKPVR